MSSLIRVVLSICVALLAGAAGHAADKRAPVTILISIDGFRADYLARGLTPRLSILAVGGVSAAMRPSFPSVTFPNHWAMVTGFTPDHSGIVANRMEDPARPGEMFDMKSDDPFWWNTVPPIWVDAEQAGIRTAPLFWPGSIVAIGGRKEQRGLDTVIVGGTRPSDWVAFNAAITGPQRVEAILDWMRRPAAIRPHFVTLYVDIVDTAGHHHGPNSPELNAAVAQVDREVGLLVDGLAVLRQPANLVIVADHGMAQVREDGLILASTLADPADFHLVDQDAVAYFAPTDGHQAALERALLRSHPHVRCWRKGEMPARFHYGSNPRITPFVCLADPGYLIRATVPKDGVDRGAHGYDNDLPEMRALFIANGPAFATGKRLPDLDDVDVAPLLRDLIGLPQKAGDGSDAVFRGVLRPVRPELAEGPYVSLGPSR